MERIAGDERQPFADQRLLKHPGLALVDDGRGDDLVVGGWAPGELESQTISDPDVLEDFFDQEFRYGAQPDNRISLTHRGDDYTATLLGAVRLNDFFDAVERLPDASFDVGDVSVTARSTPRASPAPRP